MPTTYEKPQAEHNNYDFRNYENVSRDSNEVEMIDESQRINPGDGFVRFLKGAFLFLPGAFLLFGSTEFFFYALFKMHESILDFSFRGGPWMALFALMTLIGSSARLKDPKSLGIPGAIIGVAAFSFLFFDVLLAQFGINSFGSYSLMFFPLALMAAVFVRDWIKN